MSREVEPGMDAVRRALAEAASARPAELGRLRARLEDEARDLRRRRLAATGWAALPVLAWLGSVAFHPVHADVCPGFARTDLLLLGIVPAAAWLVGALLVWRDAPWAQLLVRATWWSLHITGVVLTWTRPGLLPYAFPAAALGGGAALLVLGARGIAPFELEGPLRPRRHTAEIVLLSVLGAADLLTVAAANVASEGMHDLGGALVLALLPGVIGVVTLRRWAPHATLAGNALLLFALAEPAAVGVPTVLAAVLAGSALVQMALAARVLVSLVRGVEADLAPNALRVEQLARGIVALAVAAALAGALAPTSSEALSASCSESLGPFPGGAP